MSSRLCHSLLFLTMSVGPAFAQGTGPGQLIRFDTSRSGTCPSLEVVERALGTDRFAIGTGWTFFLSRDATTYQNSLPSSGPSDVKPPLFAKVTIYQRAPLSGRVLVSWQADMGKKCTWAAPTSLLIPDNANLTGSPYNFAPQPLKVRDLLKKDPQNQLTLKAILSTLNVRGEEGVPAYETPLSVGPPVVQLKLFEHFSVYARQQGAQRGPSGENWHVLLGKNEFGQEQLIGWVSEDDIYFWNSRMAAFWSGSGLGRGWANEDLRGNPFVSEPPGVTEQSNRNVSRFPILDMQPSSTEVQLAADRIPRSERTSLALSRLIEKYRIVLPAKACKRGTSDCLDPDKIEEIRRRYQQRVDSLRQIDIMFLIDGTESMDVYFKTVASSVRQFTKEILGTAQNPTDLSIRIGAAAYGDYEGAVADPSKVYYEPLVKFHDPRVEGSQALDPLDSYAVQNKRDKHLDKLEAPFAGLIRAATGPGWRAEAGFHIVIHIADHGNRELGKTSGEPQSKIVETVGIEKVAEALKSNRIIYVPISVVGRLETQPRESNAREVFLSQGERLMALRGLAAVGQENVIKTYKDPRRAESREERSKAVLGALHAGTQSYFRADRQVALTELCLRAPGNESCKELRELEATGSDLVSRIADVVTTEMGLTKAQIDNIFSRSQTVSYAWAKAVANSGDKEVETLTHWIAMETAQLRTLRESLQGLCNIVRPGSGDQTMTIRIEGAIRDAVKIGAGGEDVQPSQMMATALSLPFWERTDVLSRRINIISQMVQQQDKPESVETVARWRKALCVSGYLLSLVERGQRISDITALQIDEKGNIRNLLRNAIKPYDWFVKTERGEGFFYIPVEYLP